MYHAFSIQPEMSMYIAVICKVGGGGAHCKGAKRMYAKYTIIFGGDPEGCSPRNILKQGVFKEYGIKCLLRPYS